MSAFALRDYQRECLDAIALAYRRGRRRLLVSLPTGTGNSTDDVPPGRVHNATWMTAFRARVAARMAQRRQPG